MEQGGASGLPPLLPSVPVPVPVSDPEPIVEQVVEQELCNLTELVPVRSKQLIIPADNFEAVDEELVDDPLEGQPDEAGMQEDIIHSKNTAISPSDDFEEDTDVGDVKSVDVSSETLSETTSEAQPESIVAAPPQPTPRPELPPPPSHVPPHLLGRTVENPLQDVTGRRIQKPRLGVKVPYRNLTSQIVTQKEIAQEIYERTAKNNPGLVEGAHQPIKASIANTEIFTRKLTQRLNSSITSPATKAKVAIVPDSIGTLKALLPNKQSPAVVDGLRLSPGFTYNEKEKAMDDAELLSILEGDGDPLWLPDKLLRKPETSSSPPTVSMPTSQSPGVGQASPATPKLDPNVEKELALKQLMELPLAFPPKKPEKKEREKRPRRRGAKGKASEEPLEDPSLPEEPVSAPVPETQELVEEMTNGGNVENAPPAATPLKKVTSNRKRKMTPEVEAVLKKPKTKKNEPVSKPENVSKTEAVIKTEAVSKPETVANGKAKGSKASSLNQGSQMESGKKKSIGGKKPPPQKTETELVVTNGSSENNVVKKKGVKKVGKAKSEENLGKKPTAKSPPVKAGKPKASDKASTTPNKLQPPPSPKVQKPTPTHSENVVEEAKEDQPMEGIEEETAPILEPVEGVQDSNVQQKKTRINRELEHLLGDEGAVNMLYAVEGHKRKGSSCKDLGLKARLVKTAVMRLSTSPQGHMPLALRARRSLNVTEPPKLVKMGGNRKQRHHSSESIESMRSPPYLTPVDGVPSQSFSPRQKLTADDSRIIRRHSSSSSFSSPSVSPRRVSAEDGHAQTSSGTPRKRGVPIFVRDKAKSLTYVGKKKTKVQVNPVAFDSVLGGELQKKNNLLPNPAALKSKDLRAKAELMKSLKLDNSSAVAKRVAKLQKVQLLAQRKAVEEFAKAQKAAEELRQVQQNASELEGSNVLPALPTVIKQEGKKNTAAHSPEATSKPCECTIGACLASCATCVTGPLFCVSPTGYSNLCKSLHPKGKKGNVEEKQRASARHCAGTYNYKEITVRRYDNIVHIILAPVSTKMSSALNVQVLRELRDALQQVRKDDQCRIVLLSSSGSIFCQGVDFFSLIHNNNEKRKTAAFEMSLALKDFLKCVAHFPKPLVAGVQGATIGLGVTMLPLFDMVFASDKATFQTPYAQMGQVPEGGATLTLPYMLGHAATSELLLNCRKMTANEALQCGLVTRVLWPDRFMEELIPIVKTVAQHSSQSMEATKALLRHGLRTKFDAALESETHLLVEHWTSKECQASFQRMVDKGEVCLQRQRSVDA